ncbi:hypothetical protein NQ314_019292, partial [Rhamnusium bicolor]
YKFFVFSAFYDQRKQRTIRVIGATKTRGPERVWCRMWYKVNDFNSSYHISVTVPAKIKVRITRDGFIFIRNMDLYVC